MGIHNGNNRPHRRYYLHNRIDRGYPSRTQIWRGPCQHVKHWWKVIKLSIFVIAFFFLISFSSASINITVQSENNKSLDIVNLENYSIVETGYNNQSFDGLEYSNYEVRVISDSSLSTHDAIGFFEGSWNKLVYFALIVIILSFIYFFVRGLTK